MMLLDVTNVIKPILKTLCKMGRRERKDMQVKFLLGMC